MTYKITIDDADQLEIAFFGKLDTLGVGEIDTQIYTLLNSVKKSVYFDFSEVSYMSSMGIRLLISSIKIVKKAGCSLMIMNANAEVSSILEMTKLDKLNY